MNIKSFFAAFAFAAASIMAMPASATVIMNNTSTAICDLCTVNSTLNVDSHIVIQDINVLLTNLTHTFDNDLVISLIAPTGTTVLLSNRNGGGNDNYTNTVFDDAATNSITTGNASFTGSFKPEQLLSALNGTDAFGIWTLRVSDVTSRDVGSINSWGLDITPAKVPEPTTVALLGLGLLGFAASRRKAAKK